MQQKGCLSVEDKVIIVRGDTFQEQWGRANAGKSMGIRKNFTHSGRRKKQPAQRSWLLMSHKFRW